MAAAPNLSRNLAPVAQRGVADVVYGSRLVGADPAGLDLRPSRPLEVGPTFFAELGNVPPA